MPISGTLLLRTVNAAIRTLPISRVGTARSYAKLFQPPIDKENQPLIDVYKAIQERPQSFFLFFFFKGRRENTHK